MYNKIKDVNSLLDNIFIYDIYDLSINIGGGGLDGWLGQYKFFYQK